MLRVCILAGLAGCGRVGFDALALPDAVIDAFDQCAVDREPRGAWSAPKPIPNVNHATATDDDPVVRADGLELFFTSGRAGGPGMVDLWRSVRSTPSDEWSAPVLVPELSTADYENTPELSPDGLTMWFVSDRPGGVGGEDIWVTTRAALDDAWTPPVVVTELSSPGLDRAPSVYLDGLAILFHSNRGGGQGGLDFWIAFRESTTAPWSTPVNLGAPNSAGAELRGWMSPCGLELYFQADPAMATMTDFYVVRRDALDQPFGPRTRIDELSSAGYDQDIRLSPDRRHVVFSSGRAGDGDLYESSR